ncbi:uncharacterized protein PAC_13414 [Phialocephala subalpina]|uniref:Uncharacterized protein n=1 Tax=Phialocephala subalpina TaxID=576137 RepID=A0A1L7XEY8_9HELO|nr:uncharacterized protein PAC_13414 [Phialocephala subalpina]
MGVKTPWLDPELHNSKSEETSYRLAAPVGSAIVDGAVSPSATNNKSVDHCLQMPLDESIGGVDGDNWSQAPTADNSDISALDAIPFDLKTSHSSSRVHTALEQTKRKRIAHYEIDGLSYLPLAGKVEALFKLSLKTLDRFQRIISLEILAIL